MNFKKPSFTTKIKHTFQNILKKQGLKISQFPEPEKRRRFKIMQYFNIDLVLDIGANIGSYGKELREMGYKGRIISFEPTESAYQILSKKCQIDTDWDCQKIALGFDTGTTKINISRNSKSSSILKILPLSIESAPDSQFVKKEDITIKRLDDIFWEICKPENNVMLKIDTQGYEEMVLKGAEESLDRIDVIQLELSFEPLYEKEKTFFEMVQVMDKLGYEMYSLETELSFTNPETGKLLQVDCIFCRNTKTS